MLNAKKYKFVIRDKHKNIKYIIYSNRELTKKQKIQEIRNYVLSRQNKIPEPFDKINIIADD